MNKYILASWLGNPDEWWSQEQGNLYKSESGRFAYKHALTFKHIVLADCLDDAKIKHSVGACRFAYVNRGRSIFDGDLTAGDRTAIHRTSSMILRLMSDEAIMFLLTAGGVVPAENANDRLQQLRAKILGALDTAT